MHDKATSGLAAWNPAVGRWGGMTWLLPGGVGGKLWRPLLSILGLALGFLGLGAQPAWAASGIYPPGAAHEESHYQVQATGSTVIVHMTALHAPVQHQARQRPTLLFRVPAALRPAVPVAWEVEGWPVRADGAPALDRVGPRRFTLQVGSDGAVRYVNNAQVDHVGYLRYAATLAWPVAGPCPACATAVTKCGPPSWRP